MLKFKEGDRVQIINTREAIRGSEMYGFTGSVGKTYIIRKGREASTYNTYHMQGANWCKEVWLELANIVVIGGE